MKISHILILIAVAITAIIIVAWHRPPSGNYIDDNGRVHFQSDRGNLEYYEEAITEDGQYQLKKIRFNSNGTWVYGQIWIPSNQNGSHGAILFLPGAGGTKEAGQMYADMVRGRNIAVFALDQRGFGQTEGNLEQSLDAQYEQFLKGSIPMPVLMAYDALRAFDYLNLRPDIKKSNICIIGESLGGRNAIIAGALEPKISLVVGISTGGYGLQVTQNSNTTRFLRSFDPDNYISQISPRKVVIFHSTGDSLQPISVGLNTYNFAKEPKSFYQASCKTHGFCKEEMEKNLLLEIDKYCT